MIIEKLVKPFDFVWQAGIGVMLLLGQFGFPKKGTSSYVTIGEGSVYLMLCGRYWVELYKID